MKRITNYLLVITSLVVGAAAGAQPTAAEWAAFKARASADSARMATLEKVVGVQDAMLTNAELRARGRPAETIAGNYNHSYRILQFGDAFGDVVNRFSGIDARFAALTPSGSVVVAPPASSPVPPQGMFAPLTAQQQAEFFAALQAGVGRLPGTTQELVNKITVDVKAGRYAQQDTAIINAVAWWYYGGATQAQQQAMAPYLALIDQRDPAGNRYPPGDPRLKPIGLAGGATGTVVVPPQTTGNVVSGDLVHIGGTSSALSAEQAYGQTMLSISAGVWPGSNVGGDAALLFTARSPFSSSIMYQTGGDQGWRHWWNYKPCGQTLCHADPALGVIGIQFERDNSYSWTYYKPLTAAAGPFEGLPGKSLSIYPGGFNTAARGPNVDIFSGQAGRGMRLGVTVTGANNPTWMVQLSPDGRSTQVMVDGVMRTLRACGSQVCF